MGLSEILTIVFSSIGCFGIICALFIFTIKLCIEKIAESLQQKYTLQFDKELEKYKSNLDNCKYITKVQYDVKFEIYRNITSSFFNLILRLDALFSDKYFYSKKELDYKQIGEELKNTADCLFLVQNSLHENAAFIEKEFFDEYSELFDTASRLFDKYNVAFKDIELTKIKDREWRYKNYEIVADIHEKWSNLNDKLREYLKCLSVIE